MFHALDYSFAGSDFVNDTIYVGACGARLLWTELKTIIRGANAIKCDAEEQVRVK
jgi:hypothetical protein